MLNPNEDATRTPCDDCGATHLELHFFDSDNHLRGVYCETCLPDEDLAGSTLQVEEIPDCPTCGQPSNTLHGHCSDCLINHPFLSSKEG